jgi:hypothetical protein
VFSLLYDESALLWLLLLWTKFVMLLQMPMASTHVYTAGSTAAAGSALLQCQPG